MLFNEPKLLKFDNRFGAWRSISVSVLFNEPKLLKSDRQRQRNYSVIGFSALQRAEIAEMLIIPSQARCANAVSVLFNEPKLLKYRRSPTPPALRGCFSALQRAEIAEILP